jgi:hypothetical protein
VAPSRAKLGYLNVGEQVDGREIRTVAIGPERAPFIQLTFELAATGAAIRAGSSRTSSWTVGAAVVATPGTSSAPRQDHLCDAPSVRVQDAEAAQRPAHARPPDQAASGTRRQEENLLDLAATLLGGALDLLDDPRLLYRQTTDAVRRQLHRVCFGKLCLDADDVTYHRARASRNAKAPRRVPEAVI